MKSFIVLTLCVAAALAAPPSYNGDPKQAGILRYDNDNIGVGGFKAGFETENGIVEQREGTLVNAGTENEAVEVRGQYSYVGPDGVTYTVNYVADAAGFHPEGAHIPK